MENRPAVAIAVGFGRHICDPKSKTGISWEKPREALYLRIYSSFVSMGRQRIERKATKKRDSTQQSGRHVESFGGKRPLEIRSMHHRGSSSLLIPWAFLPKFWINKETRFMKEMKVNQ
jgi:hypothetical protein